MLIETETRRSSMTLLHAGILRLRFLQIVSSSFYWFLRYYVAAWRYYVTPDVMSARGFIDREAEQDV